MSLIPTTKSKTKKLKSIGLFIVLFFLLAIFIYPGLLWDISFLGHEVFFYLKNLRAANTESLKEIPECKNWNVILISLDTLRADRLGHYGYKRATSPNIDRFAKECMVFKNAFSNAYHTLPSHMSIFTSLYPPTHKINLVKEAPLAPNLMTLAQILKNNGYHTAWAGPLDDISLDLERGFERGIDNFYPPLFTDQNRFRSEEFSDILENTKGKFFIFLHSYINHAPYFYPGKFNDHFSDVRYSGKLPRNHRTLVRIDFMEMRNDYRSDPEKFSKDLAHMPSELKAELIEILESADLEKFRHIFYKLNNNLPRKYRNQFIFYDAIAKNTSKEDILALSNKYDNGVYYADYLFGSFINELKQRGLWDKTIIVVTADHGEELFEHKGFDHANFYEHTIHVPLMIKIPRMTEKVEITKLEESIDIVPMILGFLRIEKPSYMQGKNILLNTQKNDYVYGFSFGDMYVRSKKWKYMVHLNGAEELYYLPADPGEKNNLINSRSIIVKKYKTELRDELAKWKIRQF
jgi:arylsulfatase A-like enzyme